MTHLSYHSSNLSLIALETMRLLGQINGWRTLFLKILMGCGSNNKCLVSVTTPLRVLISNYIVISQNSCLNCGLHWRFNNYIEGSYQLYF